MKKTPAATAIKPVPAVERAVPAASAPTAVPSGFLQSWTRFWFTPISPVGMHALRVATGLLLLAWALPFAGQVEAMFSLQGWFDHQAHLEASRLPVDQPPPMPIGWSLFYLAGDSTALVHVLYWSGIAAFLLFTLGIAVRLAGVWSWLMMVSIMANPAMRFEADYLLNILTFYLMIGYVLYGQWSSQPSLTGRIFGTRDTWLFFKSTTGEPAPSYAANLVVRLLQVHFALIIVTSAFHKLQSGRWWYGAGFWFPLHSNFNTTKSQMDALVASRDSYVLLLSLVQYLALAWQFTFPLFAWRPARWARVLLLGGMALAWIANFWIYGLPLFGPIYVIAGFSYLTPAEWAKLRQFVFRFGNAEKQKRAVISRTGR